MVIQPFKNKKVAKELNNLTLSSDKLLIMEIMRTVEGEGMHIGTPRIFVRVGGCAIGCRWCDTKHSWTTKGHDMQSIEQIVFNVLQKARDADGFLQIKEVSITGGEPLHYPQQVASLCKMLQFVGFKVNVETSGVILNEEVFSAFDYVSMDIKTPSSGVMLTPETIDHIKYLYSKLSNLYVKVVIAKEKDFKWLKSSFPELLTGEKNPIILTPCCDNTKDPVNPESLAQVVTMILGLNRGYNIRVVSQQHKLLSIY